MPVRVGFIGAGGIAGAHMNALQALEDVQIVAVADIDRGRAESAATRFVAKAYCDAGEMLESEQIDALYVCVPPFAHGNHELMAAEKGIHLFVEKPITISLEHGRLMKNAIEKNRVISAAGYHWRYQSHTDRAKEILAGKTIGMALGYWMGGMPGVAWWRRMDQSGGQIVEQTTHIFDLARYLCGDITEVYAAYSNQVSEKAPGFQSYDVGTATLKFANGAVGTISNTCILDVPYMVGLHVVTQNLVLELHGDLKIIEPGHTEIFTGGRNAMLEENKVFISAVKSGDPTEIRSDYADALKTLAVTLACNESARTGKAVKVVEG